MSTTDSRMVQKKVKCMYVYLSIYLFAKKERKKECKYVKMLILKELGIECMEFLHYSSNFAVNLKLCQN